MSDKLSIQDVADLIKKSLDIDAEFNESTFFLKVDEERIDYSIEISTKEIQSKIDELDNLNEANSTALYSDRYYEVLVREESPLPRPGFWTRSEDVHEFDDTDNGIHYSFGIPSDVYSIFLLNKLNNIGFERYFFSPRRVLHRLFRRDPHQLELIEQEGQKEPFPTPFDVIKSSLPRVYTLRIKSNKNISIKQFEDYVHAMLFQLSYNMDISFVLINSLEEIARRSRIRRIRRSNIKELDPPRRTYRADLIYHYQMGVSTDSAPLEFLSYYHIAENFFEEIFEEDLINGLREKLTQPDFSYRRKNDLRDMIKYIIRRMKLRSETYTFNEIEALKLTLKKFLDLEELINRLNEIDNALLEYYRNHAVKFCGAAKVDLESEDYDKTISDLANRVYITRNSVVHSKEGSKPKYVPFHHDRQLLDEVPLVRLIAEQIIIKSSKMLN
ncbi:MAG: hypothetical protein WEA36_07955 [Balneolaceae bacterium]